MRRRAVAPESGPCLSRSDDPDAALCEAVTGFSPHLVRYAAAIVGPEDAEDVAQETLLRAWRHFGGFRGQGSLEGWLLRICRHCAVDHVRGAQRALDGIEAQAERLGVVGSEEPASQTAVEVGLLVGDLPPDEREVFVLTQFVGLRYYEAADVVGIPVGTVRSRLARARGRLVGAIRTSEAS